MTPAKQSGFWDYDLELKLIQLYAARPCLWNPNHPDYQKHPLKNVELQKISNEMLVLLSQKDKAPLGNATEEIKKKWKSLRDSFIREEKKTRIFDDYISEWKHYSSMLFLKDAGKKRNSNVQNLTIEIDPFGDIHKEDSSHTEDVTHKRYAEDLEQHDCASVGLGEQRGNPASPASSSTPPRLFKRSRTTHDEQHNIEDRTRLFGRYLACALQKMDAEDMEQAIIEISEILFRYRPTRHRSANVH